MSLESDPSLLQDFLTETAELITQLDADLVTLEATPDGPGSGELLNGIFRALHTVKGAAGFLNLEPIIRFSHAAEDALNRLRKGEVPVTPTVIDALLKSVDVLREMTAALASRRDVPECPPELLEQLHRLVAGAAAPAGSNTNLKLADADAPPAAQAAAPTHGPRPLVLPAQKQDLLSFMVTDMQETAQQMGHELAGAASAGERSASSSALAQLAETLAKTLEFFDLADLGALMHLFAHAAGKLPHLAEPVMEDLLVRLGAVKQLVDLQASALAQHQVMTWPLATLTERIKTLSANQALPQGVAGGHGGDVDAVLALDGVTEPADQAPAQEPSAPVAPVKRERGPDRRQHERRADEASAPPAESTIRVEVGRLEALLNLVGQLVLTKNRFLGMSRKLRTCNLPHETLEEMNAAANELDRLTGSLQVGVMRTRMQPMAKLFERYPRVIRDVARATHKQIDLEIVGKETEVDKGVLELLSDPLVHILRNSADHGVEPPEVRERLGKPAMGRIRLGAEHQGSHVRVEITDDGKGLDRELIGRKAVERGLATAEQVAAMSEGQVFQFIFAAGFSTAEKVSDLSGRGVGMDVVKTNIAKLGGAVNLSSVKGKGTTVEIIIPLTVAIMPAMVVGVGKHLYAIPLTSITEIVRPQASAMHTVAGQAVMRLRDGVLPLVDLRRRLNEASSAGGPAQGFAVVVKVGSQSAGLIVERLVGQQEVVIKPLDDKHAAGGPFSGATIREDGGVSLILDVIQLIRDAGASPALAAA